MNDLIIDRSPEQKRLRVNKLRAELLELGYSVVKTDWLHKQLDRRVFDFSQSGLLERAS